VFTQERGNNMVEEILKFLQPKLCKDINSVAGCICLCIKSLCSHSNNSSFSKRTASTSYTALYINFCFFILFLSYFPSTICLSWREHFISVFFFSLYAFPSPLIVSISFQISVVFFFLFLSSFFVFFVFFLVSHPTCIFRKTTLFLS
jgi:hypothetical protein